MKTATFLQIPQITSQAGDSLLRPAPIQEPKDGVPDRETTGAMPRDIPETTTTMTTMTNLPTLVILTNQVL